MPRQEYTCLQAQSRWRPTVTVPARPSYAYPLGSAWSPNYTLTVSALGWCSGSLSWQGLGSSEDTGLSLLPSVPGITSSWAMPGLAKAPAAGFPRPDPRLTRSPARCRLYSRGSPAQGVGVMRTVGFHLPRAPQGQAPC